VVVEAIIFLHCGDAGYLSRVLRQARAANPNTPILFLGDEVSIPRIRPYAECYDVAKHSAGVARFLKSYVHMSRNPAKFTRRSIGRWFVLRDFCRSQGITRFFYADSDVLLFAPVESVFARLDRAFGNFDVALGLASGTYSTCGHASLWLDLDRLGEFCAMVEGIYTLTDAATFLELVAFHQLPIDSGVPDAGLVSDMTLLDVFRRRSTARIVDSGAILEGAVLDHNVNLAEQAGHRFLMADGVKQLVWHGGAPHGVLEDGGTQVRFDALHCQGEAKRRIRAFTSAIDDDGGASAIEGEAGPETLIRAAYRVLLGREPDVIGAQHWTNQLATGLTPLRLLRAFIDSEEFKGLLIDDEDGLQPKHDLVVALEALLRHGHDDDAQRYHQRYVHHDSPLWRNRDDRGLVWASFSEDTRFFYPRNDDYWNPRNTDRHGLYEPEIDWLLRRAAKRPYALIDCGANLGYWSIVASSASYGRHPAVAIEASRANFQILTLNAKANDNRFAIVHGAIWNEPGKLMRLFGKKHYGMSLRTDWHPADIDQSEDVETVTVDEIAKAHLPRLRHPPLLKLDVEGAEIEAMKGARGTIDSGALVIYEDHSKQADHPISRFILAQEAFEVWWMNPERELERITAIEQVAAVKQNPKASCNFFTYRAQSPWSSIFNGSWLSRLRPNWFVSA
jgi:FkbM family methyltransferase